MAQFFRLKRLVNLGVLTRSRNKSEWNRLSVYRDLLTGIETPGRTGCDKFRVALLLPGGALSVGILKVAPVAIEFRVIDLDQIFSLITEQLVFDRRDHGANLDDVTRCRRIILVNCIR